MVCRKLQKFRKTFLFNKSLLGKIIDDTWESMHDTSSFWALFGPFLGHFRTVVNHCGSPGRVAKKLIHRGENADTHHS